MKYLSGQPNIVTAMRSLASHQILLSRAKHQKPSLLLETAFTAVCVILLIRLIATSAVADAGWFLIPSVLVAASLVPTWVRQDEFPMIGMERRQIRTTMGVLCPICALVFPVMFVSLWLLKSRGLELPLPPAMPKGQNWFCWLFYQFMYVAVAEEFFFRGYIQGNILKLANTLRQNQRLNAAVSIVLSAALFATAHVIVQGETASVLTFLPGLVLGWLFIRTRSLLAPILFHGLANTFYNVAALVLA